MLDESGEVAKWWTRELLQMFEPPSSGSLFNREEMTSKGMVAYGVQRTSVMTRHRKTI